MNTKPQRKRFKVGDRVQVASVYIPVALATVIESKGGCIRVQFDDPTQDEVPNNDGWRGVGNLTKIEPGQLTAEEKLIAAGFIFYWTVERSALNPELYGKYFVRENAVTTDKFWLNDKTMNQLPV